MYYFIEIACVIAEMWMVHTFLESYYTKRKCSVLQTLGMYGTFGAIIAVLSMSPNLSFVRLAVTFWGIWVTSLVLFNTKIIQGLLSGVAYCSIVAVNDVISVVSFQLCGVSPDALMASNPSRSLLLIVAHILLFGIVIILCILNRKSASKMSVKILLPVLPCWAISILLGFVFTWQCVVMEYEWHPLFLVVLIGLLYTNIIMIYYTNKTSEQAQLKKDFEIAEHHYAMQKEYYDQLCVQQEETRALWHDISKYLRASQVDKSDATLMEAQQMLDSISQLVDVNNRVVSVILNEYFQTAKNADIAIALDVLIPAELFVTAADLYVLLGNTLDNAIEACSELPREQRCISIKLKKHNSMLYYEISNPYDEKHLYRARGNYHGFGLKNVAKCVEKYHGKLDVRTSDGVFCVVAHMNCL